jgi:antitoxin (DNA-binding transcriptional repressor) of toxin-antitoxin stability system
MEGTPATTRTRFIGRSRAKQVAASDKTVTVTVGELRTSFKAVEAKLAKGTRVQITRRGEVVAELVAPSVSPAESSRSRLKFVDLLREREDWLQQTWGDQPVNIDTTALISEGRDRDFLS